MIKVRLADIALKVSSGLTPNRSNKEFWQNGMIDWVKTEQIGERYIFSSTEKISLEALEKTSIKLNPINTISIAMYGEGKTRGSVSILKNEMTTNQACCNIIVNEKKADVDFIYYKLKTQYDNLRALSSGIRKNLNSNDIKEFEITIPNLNIQQKIAFVLSALDDKIELNNKINAELEAMAKTLYDYWFVQFDFPDINGRPYKSSGGKMVYDATLKREIPKGWEVKSLFEVCNVQYGFPFSTEFFNEENIGFPVIRIRDILNNSISNFSTQEQIDEKYLIEKGDILVGMDGNFHVNYWSKESCYLNQRVVMIKEKEIPNIYIRYQIEPFIQQREKSVSRTTVGHLSDKDLKAINIIVPSKEVLGKIEILFAVNLKKIIRNQNQNQELAQVRDWLLPMLMNGQVTVGEAEEKMGMVAE